MTVEIEKISHSEGKPVYERVSYDCWNPAACGIDFVTALLNPVDAQTAHMGCGGLEVLGLIRLGFNLCQLAHLRLSHTANMAESRSAAGRGTDRLSCEGRVAL